MHIKLVIATGVVCATSAFAGSYTDNFPPGPLNDGNRFTFGSTGVPLIDTNTLILTLNSGSQHGTAWFTSSGVELDPGAIDSFTATFNLILGPGSGTPADGFGFCFGPDVFPSNGDITEEGWAPTGGAAGQPGGGVAVTWDTYDNNAAANGQPSDPTAIEVWVGANNTAGYTLAGIVRVPNTTLVDSKVHPVTIQLKRAGTITVIWGTQTVFTNLLLPGWIPVHGYFGAGARTGGATEFCGIQNLQITTTAAAAAPPTVTTPPASTTVLEGTSATFSVVFDGEAPLTVQWYKGTTPIPGATNTTVTLDRVSYNDNGAQITAQVSNGTTTVTSAAATLNVTKDTTPPTIVSATGDASYTKVTLKFSEPIGTAGTFTISPSLAVSAAQILPAPNDNLVVLTTAQQGQGVTYTITINGTKDQAATPNTIAANTTIQFNSYVDWAGIVYAQFWNGIGGTVVADLTNSVHYQNDPPDTVAYFTSLDASESYAIAANPTARDIENYGTRITGFIRVLVTTNYYFYLRSDDSSTMWLSTDATPGNLMAAPICYEPGCCNGFQAEEAGHAQTSAAIPLTAGQKYYFLVLHKEGGGGDYVQVAMKVQGDTVPAAALKPISAQVVTPVDVTGSTLTITQQPYWDKGPVVEGDTAPMATYATGTSPLIYGNPVIWQWRENGVPIPGANQALLLKKMTVAADNNATFDCVVSVPGILLTSSPVKLQVVADTFPAKVASAAAFPGSTKIGVEFSKDVDEVTATNVANYTVNGQHPTSIWIRTNLDNEISNEKNLVELTVATPLNAAFTLAITGVKAANNGMALTTNVTGKVLADLTYVDIGTPLGSVGGPPAPDPLAPGVYRSWGAKGFDIIAGGSDYYNNADGFGYLYTKKTNSFDVAVRVVAVAPENQWSAAGLVMRESLSQYSREYHNKVCPPNYGTNCYVGTSGVAQFNGGGGAGANDYELNTRLATGNPALGNTSNNGTGGSQGWAGTAGSSPGAPPYPNAWIRIKRIRSADGTSDHLQGFGSSDGINWVQIQDVNLLDGAHAGVLNIDGVTTAGPWPSEVYIGMGTTAHTLAVNTNTATYTAIDFPNIPVGGIFMCATSYRDFGDYAPLVIPPPGGQPTLSYTFVGGVLKLTWTGGNLYSVTNLTDQWKVIPGAANPYTVPISSAPRGFYRAGP